MIVATAGHVDHGKTLLVKALTGVDADRLPEEKKRGMTIDLGFAYLPVESNETIGFIDVPGHERFVHNMLAGVAGIDFVLFVVAADDGPMPQTAEHLAILDLLGIRQGAVALTKIDRVSTARVEEVSIEIAALFSRTSLTVAPIIPVSAVTGEGIDTLKAYLLAAARKNHLRPVCGNFRMAIDRCFSVSGAGLIVTGMAVAGSLKVGDAVRVSRAGLALRARAIHAQNAASETGSAGQRCAINLAGSGLKRELIERGDWIVTGDVPEPVAKFDARLRVLASELRPLAHWTPVHVHLGASDVTGRVAILEGSSIAPGNSALVQIALDRPVGTLNRDGLILRDQSAKRTIGGGRVIDIFPPVRGRARPDRLAYLRAIENDEASTALAAALQLAPRGGVYLDNFARNRNLTDAEATDLFTRLSVKRVATSRDSHRDRLLGFTGEEWKRMKTVIVESLSAIHKRAPNTVPNEGRLFLEAGIRLPQEAAAALVSELVAEGTIVRDSSGVRLRVHVPQLGPPDAALWKRAEALFCENPMRPPTVNEIASALALQPSKAESFLVRVSRIGLLTRVNANRFFLPPTIRRYANLVEIAAVHDAMSGKGIVTGAALRDRAGVGRGLAIEVLEYFDRIKFTRRVGDAHQLVREVRDVFGGE